MARTSWCVAALVVAASCAHMPVDKGGLDALKRPAIVARLVDPVPKADVFQKDGSLFAKVGGKSPKAADDELARVLLKGDPRNGLTINRYEIVDAVASKTRHYLHKQHPWSQALTAVEVARVLETFLVEDRAQGKPNYQRLRDAGADSVLEILLEEYGMRAANGRVGVYVLGTAKLMTLDGAVLYARSFVSDETGTTAVEGTDPADVLARPPLFREHLQVVLTAISETVADDLTPGGMRFRRQVKAVERQRPQTND